MAQTIEAPAEPTDLETAEADGAAESQTPRFSIHPLRAGKQSSLYEDAVLALIDAQDAAEIDPATGKPEIIAITVFVPGEKKAQGRHIRDFREAATRHDRSARIRAQEENADGSVSIEFTLTERLKRTRGGASE
jgi:hypothetical protein